MCGAPSLCTLEAWMMTRVNTARRRHQGDLTSDGGTLSCNQSAPTRRARGGMAQSRVPKSSRMAPTKPRPALLRHNQSPTRASTVIWYHPLPCTTPLSPTPCAFSSWVHVQPCNQGGAGCVLTPQSTPERDVPTRALAVERARAKRTPRQSEGALSATVDAVSCQCGNGGGASVAMCAKCISTGLEIV